MSLKQEIETWVEALKFYDNNEFDEALKSFDKVSDTSKILFNMGVINATLGQHEQAVECYQRALKLDQYLAVAYFQQGVSNFLIGDFEEALANFNDTLLYLRGNSLIDYSQLGLLFKLYSCEVLFNRGLCYIYLEQIETGMQDLEYAVREKVVEDHNVIDDAIKAQAKDYTVFSIPVGVVYRPNEAKVRNLQQKDYLGKARLVAASDRNNAFTGFSGTELNKAITVEAKDDRPAESLSFAASNLVKPGLQSRRQQSEPPNNRNVFPPTPPPENDKPAPMSRGQSVRNGPKPIPSRLNLEKVRSNERYDKTSPEDGRPRPTRSASAAPSRGFSQREPPPRRRRDEEEDAYPDDVYDMYGDAGASRNSRSQKNSARTRERYIEEKTKTALTTTTLRSTKASSKWCRTVGRDRVPSCRAGRRGVRRDGTLSAPSVSRCTPTMCATSLSAPPLNSLILLSGSRTNLASAVGSSSKSGMMIHPRT
jgi:hypothetical protein